MSSITRYLPKNHLSYLMGKLVHLPLPRFIWIPVIQIFSKFYNIKINEAEKPVSDYESLGDFFVRRLKSGIRPLGSNWALHPADSVITQLARIENGNLIQAKGKFYKAVDFVQDPEALQKYGNGFFVTYYLCPTDYHRVHSPVDGVITKVTHIPGMLWPVNKWSTENIEEMFSINERVSVEIKTDRGLVNVVFVGATNVGYIELSFMPEIKGNQFSVFKPLIKPNLNISVKRGEELGMFRMGSTVVMLYQDGVIPSDTSAEELQKLNQKYQDQPVQVNSNFFN
ncbi:MAG: phosphatidylserine decarboxylase [Moraxellaceae bacterium]|nr:phosphatidylserine decarboxylase [Pseudobdellovibrionaceae bacterium]